MNALSKGESVVIIFSHRNTPWKMSERPYNPQRGDHQDKYMHGDDDNEVHGGLRHERADQRQKLEHSHVRVCAPNDYGERRNLYACIHE